MQINMPQVIQGTFMLAFFFPAADTFTSVKYDCKCVYILHNGSISSSPLYKISLSNNMTTKGTFWSDSLS